MNKGIARELQVSIQYMWQHVMVTGLKGAMVEDTFKEIAITEMKHAEEIAERLAVLGGVRTIKHDPIVVGANLNEMHKLDEKAVTEAVAFYKETIKLATQENDITTRRLFAQILAEEEDHLDTFKKLQD